jgi:hypothetical protein
MIRKSLLSAVCLSSFLALFSNLSRAEQAIIAVQPTTTSPVNVPSDANAQPYVNTGTGVTTIITPTITLTSYAIGNCVGSGVSVINNSNRFSSSSIATAPKGGWLTSVTIADKSAQADNIDLVIFDGSPTGTYADNTPCVLAAADNQKVLAVLHITDWITSGLSVGTYISSIHFVSTGVTGAVYAVAITRAAITLSVASSFTFKYNFIQD